MTEYNVVLAEEMKEFITRCMVAVGTREEHAQMLADCLVAADYRGHFSHGLNRVYCYLKDIKDGAVTFVDNPEIIKESKATALVDGMNLLGPIVGNFCMDLAIKKAKDVGVGIVVATRSNHFGIAGYYSMQALKENMIGLSFTNGSPKVFPTRSKAAVFATNPISLAAPGNDGDSFVLDMATSAVAYGKVEINHRKNLPIPDGWAVDENGEPTTDAVKIMGDGGLLPLGGVELSSGYKGYGLAFMVEILTGILAASAYGPNIREWKQGGFANLGQCFMAINPGNFADGFNDRLQDLMDHCRNLEPTDPEKPVLVAGDPEREHMSKCDRHGGIPYHSNQLKYAFDLANELKIAPPRIHTKFVE